MDTQVESTMTIQTLPSYEMRSYRRKVKSIAIWSISFAALTFVMFIILDILLSVISKGVPGLSYNLIATQTSGIAGGLQNAILGTLLLIALSALISAPLGILAGIYIALYAPKRFGAVIRFFSEVLAGIPSIVIGYFGYMVMVLQWGMGFSALAGGISLSIIILPYIVRTTDASFRQIPKSYLEGAIALGMTPLMAMRTVLLKLATPGILTGVLLAVSIALGETAPLIYTAGWSNFDPNLQLVKNPVAYLTYVVWTYLNEPYHSAHQLAYTAALLLVMIVLVLHVLVRMLQRGSSKHA